MGQVTIILEDETATARLGEDVALASRPGDVIALRGDLGAGKTTLARGLVRALSGDPHLEIPSPTYTLVQNYDAYFPVAHYDFYRLSSEYELEELGFRDALASGVTIVEWAERFLRVIPATALRIEIEMDDGAGRRATIYGDNDLFERLMRSRLIRGFLQTAGWGDAFRGPFTGDASTRIYESVELPGRPRCLVMNAAAQPDGPKLDSGRTYSEIAHLAENVTPYVAIAAELKSRGFSAPEVFAADLEDGILLIEDLDGENFTDRQGRPVSGRYLSASELLARIHHLNWPEQMAGGFGACHRLPEYDLEAMMIEVDLLIDWYLPATGNAIGPSTRNAFHDAWKDMFDFLAKSERSLVLRDFHSPNLIWRSAKVGMDRLGIIDFQDALFGPSAYDVASLAQDARVTIPAGLERSIINTYRQARSVAGNFDQASFERAYAIMAAQRSSKILGIFVRLDRRDGKSGYLRHLPRMREYLQRSLRHPALSRIRELYGNWGILEELEFERT